MAIDDLGDHYNDVRMSAMASQITSLTGVYSTVYSGRDHKKTSKLRVNGLCAGNSPVTGDFPAQTVNNAENAAIWWRHHDKLSFKINRWDIKGYFGAQGVECVDLYQYSMLCEIFIAVKRHWIYGWCYSVGQKYCPAIPISAVWISKKYLC